MEILLALDCTYVHYVLCLYCIKVRVAFLYSLSISLCFICVIILILVYFELSFNAYSLLHMCSYDVIKVE